MGLVSKPVRASSRTNFRWLFDEVMHRFVAEGLAKSVKVAWTLASLRAALR